MQQPVEVAVAILERDGKVLVARRPPKGHLEGVWEFPGGKLRPGEPAEHALRRELWEEVAVEAGECAEIGVVEFAYEARSVRLHFFRVTAARGEPRGVEGQEILWVRWSDLLEMSTPEANRELIQRFAERQEAAR